MSPERCALSGTPGAEDDGRFVARSSTDGVLAPRFEFAKHLGRPTETRGSAGTDGHQAPLSGCTQET